MEFVGTPLEHIAHITLTELSTGFEKRSVHAPPAGWNHQWASVLAGLLDGKILTEEQVKQVIADGLRKNATRYLDEYCVHAPAFIAEPSVIAFGIDRGDFSFKDLRQAHLTDDQLEEIRYALTEGGDILDEWLEDLCTVAEPLDAVIADVIVRTLNTDTD